MTKVGEGVLTLAGNNTYTGGSDIQGGTLRGAVAGAFGSGAISLNGGSLELAGDTGLNFGNNVVMNVDSNITSDRLTAGAGVTHTLGTLDMEGFGLTISPGSHVTSGTAGVVFGATTLSHTAMFIPQAGTSLTLASVTGDTFNLVDGGDGDMTISGALNLGTGGVKQQGNGTLTLSGNNSFSGGVEAAAGVVRATNANAFGSSEVFTDGGNITIASDTALSFSNNVSIFSDTTFTSDRLTPGTGLTHNFGDLSFQNNYNLTLTIAAGSNVTSGTAGIAFNNVSLNLSGQTFAPGAGTLLTLGSVNTAGVAYFNVDGAGNTAIGLITGNQGTVYKNGSGTLTLSGANDFTGGINLFGGTVTVATLPTSGTDNSPLGNGGTVFFSHGKLQYTGPTVTSTHSFGSGDGGGEFEITQAGTTVTLNSGFSGQNSFLPADALIKSGLGTLIYSGNQDNSGLDTTINAGKLILSKTSAQFVHAADDLIVNNGGTAQLAGTGGDQIVDSGLVTIDTGGVLDFNGRNESFDGLSDGSNGGGSITNTSTTANSIMTIGANNNANGPNTFSGVISNGASKTMAVVKTGTGTEIFSGNNTYTGGLTISGGTVVASTSAGALGAGTLTLNGGALNLVNDTALSFGRNTTISTGSTITLDRLTAGAGVTHTLGTLSIGASQLTVSEGSNVTSGTAGLTFGATTLTANGAIFAPDAGTLLTLGTVAPNTGNRSFSVAGAGNTAITGAITTGSGSVTMNGTGMLTLSGANTFTGGVNLNSGILSVATLPTGTTGSSTIGTGGTVAFFGDGVNHGTLQYTGATVATTHAFSLTKGGGGEFNITQSGTTLTLNSAVKSPNNSLAADALIKSGAGILALTGTTDNTGLYGVVNAGTLQLGKTSSTNVHSVVDLAINNGGTAQIAGTGSDQIWDSGSVHIDTGGVLDLNGKNENFDGLTDGANGGGSVTNTSASTASTVSLGVGNTSNTYSFSGVISDGTSKSTALVRNGFGTQILTGNNTYTGGTTVTAGTLQLGNGGTTGSVVGDIFVDNFGPGVLAFNHSNTVTYNNILSGGGALNQIGSGMLVLGGANTLSGTTTISSGSIKLNNANALQNSNVNVGTANGLLFGTTSNTYTIGDLSGSGSFVLADTSGSAINLVTGNNSFADQIYSGNMSGGGSFTKVGGNTILTLTGNNNYTGPTEVDAGAINFASLSNLGSNSSIILNGGGLQYATGNTTDISTRTITIGASGATIDTNGNDVTFANSIGNNGTGGFTKAGAGTLIFVGSNSYTGATSISGGTLQIGNGGTTGSVSGDITDNGTLAFNRSDSFTYNNILSGTGGLSQIGTGTITLGSANTISGATTISSGAIQLSNANALQNSSINVGVANGLQFGLGIGTFNIGGLSGSFDLALSDIGSNTINLQIGGVSTSSSYSGNISGNGGITKVGSGNLTLSGNNGYTGATAINAGTVNFASNSLGNGGAIHFGGGTLQYGTGNTTDISGRTVTLNSGGATIDTNNNNVVFANAIGNSGTGGLTKIGAGKLTLSGHNTYSGNTTVSVGTVRATSDAGALGSGSLALTGGSLELANDTALNFGRNTTVSSSTTITSDRLTAGAGVTQTLGTLSLGGRTLTLNAGSNVSSGTAGLTFGNTTLSANSSIFSTGANTLLTLGALGGNFSFTKQGAGQLLLSGASARTSGGVTVSVGTLALGNTSALGTTGVGLTLGGGSVDLATDVSVNAYNTTLTASSSILSDKATSSSAGITHTLGTLAMGAQTLTVSKGANVGSGTAGLAFGATTLSANGATFSPDAGTLLTLTTVTPTTSNRSFTVTGAGDTTIGGIISTGTGTLTKSGVGVLTLNGANTYTGATSITGGTISANKIVVSGGNSSLGNASSAVTLSGGGILSYTGNSATYTRGFTLGSGGGEVDTATSGQTLTANSNITLASALTIGGAGNTSLGGVLSSTGGLSKTGAGSLTVGNSNTYSGTTTIGAGTLNAANIVVSAGSSGLGNTSSAVVLGTASTAGILNYTGNSATYTRGFTVNDGGGEVDVATSGQTLTIGTGGVNSTGIFTVGGAGNTTINSAISSTGGLKKTGAGTLTLGGTNNFSGATTLSTGTITVGSGATLSGSTSALTVNGGTLNLNNAVSTTVSSLNGSSGTINLISGATLIDNTTGSDSFSGTLAGAGGFKKSGAGALILGNANTYSGNTVVLNGMLKISNVSGSATGSGNVTVNSGASIGGNGTLAGALDVQGTLAPGNSPGNLSTGAQTWEGGGTYAWQINDATGTAGLDPGWDTTNITGGLIIAATSGDQFTIDITSMTLGNAPGDAANFDTTQNYTWTIASASTAISGFDVHSFFLDTSDFSNALDGGHFGIATNGSNLNLTFTAATVPEPATWLLFGLGGMMLVAMRFRR
ncbi:MAG: autotransporter-associated beta strand repeat-containing protein [Chthoniobacterales bacterium]